jgi:hypothetical protein
MRREATLLFGLDQHLSPSRIMVAKAKTERIVPANI